MRFVPFKKKLNLAAKFNLLTIALVLATSVGICLFVIRLETTNYYGELLNHGTTIADTTAKNCEFGIYTENQASLLPVLESLSTDPEIAYVSIMNRQRRALASLVFKGSGEPPEPAVPMSNDLATVVHRDLIDRRDGQQYIEVLCPVMSAGSNDITDVLLGSDTGARQPVVIGYLRLGLTQEGLHKRIQQLLVSITLFTSMLVMVGIGLTIFLTRKITSPLGRLTAATQDVADGRFDSRVEIHTNDEIGVLARSFDYMRGRLRAFHDQVEERTNEITATNERLVQEIGARKTVEEQLQHDALHDSLTGLPNRALFMDRLVHAMAMAQRRKDFIFAVLFVDLDRFKVVNDSLGHVVGDQLLIALGQRVVNCLMPHDTVARLGGDEFAILLEDIRGIGNATFIAERIGTSLEAPFQVAGHEVFATASIGIALCVREYEHPDEVLRDADTAMYKAKSSGRAQYSVFEPGMHAHAVERLRLETDLRRAVERNEFVVFYQPIFSLSTNYIVGFEALVRWQHPERGLLNPADFLKMADETGIIVAIDRLVLREASRQMREWMTRFPGNGISFIGTNLSNKQITQPDFVDYVSRVLKETGLSPKYLKLEITENVIIENPEETIAMLTRLKALGVQLYIDDFGTGYSSLSYLHQLPIDGLKIDRSFIKRMGEHGENQEIIKTIMLLARDMNFNVISEGLEIEHQTEQIRALGCEYGQGYIFSKPVDSSRATVLFEYPGGSHKE
jgi:diguanylate cyclase (GGDEF)-like protein